MINALDREAFKSGTKVLALGLFILGSGIFLDQSAWGDEALCMGSNRCIMRTPSY